MTTPQQSSTCHLPRLGVSYSQQRSVEGLLLQVAALASLVLGAPSAFAQSNAVFIEQLTTSSDVNITQTGSDNVIAGAGTAAGAPAALALTLPTPGTATGEAMSLAGTDLTLTTVQTGVLNTIGMDVTSASATTISLTQTGDSNASRLFVDGGDNSITMTLTGDSNVTNIDLGTVGASVSNGTVVLEIAGDSNKANLLITPATSTVVTSSYTVNIQGDSNGFKYVNTGTEAAILNYRLGSAGSAANSNTILITKGD